MRTTTRTRSAHRPAVISLPGREIVVALIAVCVLFSAAWVSGRPHPVPTTLEIVHVQSGETLWEIARSSDHPGISTAEMVSMITRMNDLEGASVAEGAVLKIPTWKTQSDAIAVAMR